MSRALEVSLLLAYLAILLGVLAFSILVFVWGFAPWLRAMLARTPVPLMRIMAMRFRRVRPGPVVNAYIIACQSGIAVDLSDVEWAVAQGVDVEKVLRRMPQARAASPDADAQTVFHALVNAELDATHAEAL